MLPSFTPVCGSALRGAPGIPVVLALAKRADSPVLRGFIGAAVDAGRDLWRIRARTRTPSGERRQTGAHQVQTRGNVCAQVA